MSDETAPEPRKIRGKPFRKGEPSANPAGRPRKDAHVDAERASDWARQVYHADGWINPSTGYGGARDKRAQGYHVTRPLSSEEGRDLWRGNDLAARVVETKPQHALREGFDVVVHDASAASETRARVRPVAPLETPESIRAGATPAAPAPARVPPKRDAASAEQGKDVASRAMDAAEDLGVVDAFYEALCYARGTGGGAILIGANDGQRDWTQPLNMKRISKVDYLNTLEADEFFPWRYYTDPLAPKYKHPATYLINPRALGLPYEQGKNAQMRIGDPRISQLVEVHESRLVVFEGVRVSRVMHISSTNGHGDSVLTRFYEPLREFEDALASAGVLVQDFAQGVYKFKGLAEMLAQSGDEGNATLVARMRAVEDSRSTLRAMVIDSENEDFTRVSSPVNGIDAIIVQKARRAAAAADMPLVIFLGDSPGGLGSNGDAEVRGFYDGIASWRKMHLTKKLRYLMQIIFLALGDAPDKWSIEWPALWQATDKEAAEARNIQKEVDLGYVQEGILSRDEVRCSRFAGPKYSFETHVDVEADEYADLPAADPAALGDPRQPLPVEGEPGAAPADPAADPSAAPTGGESVAQVAMNGAQVTAMIAVCTAYGAKEIARQAAVTMLVVGFPGLITQAQAEDMCPEDFEGPPPAPSPFGGGGGPPGAGGGNPFAKKAPADPAGAPADKPEDAGANPFAKSAADPKAEDKPADPKADAEPEASEPNEEEARAVLDELDALLTDADAREDYDPDQPRAENGEWGEGGGGASAGGASAGGETAASVRAEREQVKAATKAIKAETKKRETKGKAVSAKAKALVAKAEKAAKAMETRAQYAGTQAEREKYTALASELRGHAARAAGLA